MQSVMKNSPAPLTGKRQLSGLDARAYNAAMDSMLARKEANQSPSSGRSQQADNRRTSAERGPGFKSKTAARKLFSPANADAGGYRQKHGKGILSAPGL